MSLKINSINNISANLSGLNHLNDNNLLPNIDGCPLCRADDGSSILKIQENPSIDIRKCQKCYVSYSSRMPVEEALINYYSHYYNNFDIKITMDRPEYFASHIYKHTKDYIDNSKSLRILDFGGGDGEVAQLLAGAFLDDGVKQVSVVVVDYNNFDDDPIDSRISLQRFNALDQLPNNKFDIILASAILEHIPDPITPLKKMFFLLNKGGVFYARTPYMEGFIRCFNKLGLSFSFGYPGHLYDMGAPFWNNIFNILLPDLKNEYSFLRSKPSLVQTSFAKSFFQTLAAYLFKFPHRFLGNKYNLVGGWEVVIMRDIQNGS